MTAVDPVALWNAKQSDYFREQDELGRNDRADVTSGSGVSRFDYEEDES